MDLPVPPANAPTPTPRACQCCAIAKSKCVQLPNTTNGPCSRCSRLKKTCIPVPTAVRKRKAPKQTRTAKLEEKIESLVTLLSQTQPIVSSPENILPVARVHEPLPEPTPAPIEPVVANAEKPESSTHFCHFPPATARLVTESPSVLDFAHGLEPSPIEAAKYLNIYRSNYTQWFPFVVIPPNMSAQDLKLKKPHLYRSIMMVASYNQPLNQVAMGKEILLSFGTSLILNGEKNLDLLQALLVYASWNFYHFSVNSRITNLLQLAIGLIFDLRLNTGHQIDGDDMFSYGKIGADDNDTMRDASVTDEHRAYLGCWFMVSTLSLCMKRMDSLRYSSHLDYCCDSLSSLAEYSTDAFAVASVRLQIIVERMQDVLRGRNPNQKVSLMAPIGMHIRLFQDELQEFKDSLPTAIQEDIQFETQYHSAETHLYEISISQHSGSDYGSYSLQRIDMLYSCLTACQAFFTSNRKIKTHDFPNVSFVNFVRLAQGLTISFKLSLLRAPGWDEQHVRQTLLIVEYIDDLREKFQNSVAYIDAKGEMKKTDAFSRCAWKLGRVKNWYEQKLKADTGNDQQLAPPGTVQTESFDFQPFDPVDDSYWQQYLGDWENFVA